MLVSLFSAKGSPGVTSTALALAACWPRQVVLVEADLSGADLAYRCATPQGGVLDAQRGVMRLAAAVRGGHELRGRHLLPDSDLLASGVRVVQGVQSAAQSRGLRSLWSVLAQVLSTVADTDVLVDLGRVDHENPNLALAVDSDVVMPVASSSLESIMHLRHGLEDLAGPLNQRRAAAVVPVLVGPDGYAAADCADLDTVLSEAGIPTRGTQPIPLDTRALERLERGEASGRWSRTLLARGARTLAEELAMSQVRP